MNKTISVPIYFDMNGRPTCSSKVITHDCMFLRVGAFGIRFYCAITNDTELERYDELGCLKPCDKCPLHGGDL